MELKTKLNETMAKKFEAVKEHTGMENNSSVVWFLISREYNRIERSKRHKVFLPNEIYDRAEKAAEARGQTMDEYIDEVTEQLLKNPNEGLKLTS